jgi:hypothetical protein
MNDVCGKGTFNGAAAQNARYEFAPCVRHRGHSGPCDSGPAETTQEAA